MLVQCHILVMSSHLLSNVNAQTVDSVEQYFEDIEQLMLFDPDMFEDDL